METALENSVWVTSPEFAGWLVKRGFRWRKLWTNYAPATAAAEIHCTCRTLPPQQNRGEARLPHIQSMSGWGVQALEAASVAARATLLKPLSRGFAMQGLPLCLLRLLPLPFIGARRIALLPSSRALQACQPSRRHCWVAFLDVLLELMDCGLPHGSPPSCLSIDASGKFGFAPGIRNTRTARQTGTD